jgi:hypothetical protein
MEQNQAKKIISIAVLGICILQILIVAARYFEAKANMNNPLIPGSLIVYIRNFSLIAIGLYVIAVLSNIFYLVTKRFFLGAVIVSFIILLSVALLLPQLYTYFYNR